MNKDWLDSVVLITSSDSAIRDFGTGFAIHREGQMTFILTCAHVVEAAGGSTKVNVNDIQATVIAMGSANDTDLAVLGVMGLDKVASLPLGFAGEKGNFFITAGFQRFNNRELLFRPLRGILGEQVQVGVTPTKFVKAWDLKITDDYQLQPGNSGSPIVDMASNVIVGVVRTRQGDGQRGLAISVEALAGVWTGMPKDILSKDILTLSTMSNEKRLLSISSLIEDFKGLLRVAPSSASSERQRLFEELQTILLQADIPENILEETYVEVGAAIAKSVLKLWAKNASIDNDTSLSLVDLLKSQTPDIIAQRRGQRQFDTIGEKIAERLFLLFESEGAKFNNGARTAIAIAVGEAFNKAKISSRLVAEYILEPSKLVRHILDANLNITQHFSIYETSFYEHIIKEACGYIIDIASQLPTFNDRDFAEILKKEDQILKKAEEILQAVQRIQDLQNSTTQAGKFEIDYRLAVLRRLDTLQLFGVTTSLVNRRHRLSPAYINLSVEQQPSSLSAEEIENSYVTESNDKIQNKTSKRITKSDKALSESKRLLIRGVAGSGKTTLLQWIAINSADRSFDGYLTQWNDTIPFYIRLRQFSQTPLPSPQDFPSLVSLAIAELMPKGWVHLQLSLGRAIVLVDGLDEIPASRREEVRTWLKDLIGNFPEIHIILTSRPHALEDSWLDSEEFQYVELQPMALNEIYFFINHWHKTIKDELNEEYEKSELDEQADHFKDTVKYNMSIRNLVANPLLCAMLCALHRDRRQELPVDRIELYEACCESLIERRDKERHILLNDYPNLNYRQKRHILEDLAYWMIKNSWSELAKEDASKRIAWKLKQMYGLSESISAADILKLFIERSSIIRESAIGRIDFTHRTFQEFLAVKSATDEMDTGLLIANAHNDQWREVIILTAGFATKQMRKQLIKGLIARGNKEKKNRYRLHLLAVSCLETCIDLESEVKTEVERSLAKIIPPKNTADAAALAVAGELAIKHLINRNYPPFIMVACIRTLALISGDLALDVLEGYARSSDPDVIDELFNDWDHFDREAYAMRILSQVSQGSPKVLKDLPSFNGIQSFKNVKSLSFSNCSQIKDFTPLAFLVQLNSLSLSICYNLEDLTSLKDMTQLTSLILYDCPHIKDISALKNLRQLTSLTLYNCPLLSDINSLAYLTQLRILNLRCCRQLKTLTPLAGLAQLTSLDLSECTQIQDLTPLENLVQLRMLKLTYCYEISDLTPLSNLHGLKSLDLLRCSQIYSLTPISFLSNLSFLYVYTLFDFASLRNLKELALLYIENCEQLTDLSFLSECTQLSSLVLKRCRRTRSIAPLENLKLLITLYISDCPNHIDLSPLTYLSNLHFLSIINSPEVISLELFEKSVQVTTKISAFPNDTSKHILIIDDKSELLYLMRRVLEDEELNVSILQDGRDGFSVVKKLLPDLLILDLKLGDISGQDILKQIKSDPVTANIPVIVYTAAVLEAEEVSNLIVNDPQFYTDVRVVHKPFELEDLLVMVEGMLGLSVVS